MSGETQIAAPAAAPGRPEPDAEAGAVDDGRIPLRTRIGVTGHLDIHGDRREAVFLALDRIQRVVLGARADDPEPVTSTELTVVSQLAEGSDRLVIDYVFDYAARCGQEARLEVILPMQRTEYSTVQGFSERSRDEFEGLLAASTFTIEPAAMGSTTHEQRADAYADAGKKVIERCDVLIALWNGSSAAGKRGGTGQTLLNAAALGRACVWISTDDGGIVDNLEPGTSAAFFERVRAGAGIAPDYQPSAEALATPSLARLSATFAQLDAYNREPRPGAGPHRRRLVDALASRLIGTRFIDGFGPALDQSIERRVTDGCPTWLAGPSARASALAGHYQRRFRRFATTLLIAASAAAAMLAAGVASGVETALWGALECVFLIIALLAFLAVRRLRLHARWLSYRVLAERFRTARYVAPTGIDFREQARLQGLWVGGHSEEWLMRAFEEVWDRQPHDVRLLAGRLDEVKRHLTEDWVQGQIDYHARAHRDHERLKRRLTLLVYVAFGLTVVLATVDAIFAGLQTARRLQAISKGLTIFLPVLGASVGAALTIDQHQALAEHSAQMRSNLRIVKADLESAADATSLREATMAAVRLIAPETGTWFGALWFLDIEHP